MSSDSIDPFTEKFFAWMDSENLKPQDLARLLNKKEQTLFNWRSRGVPKSQWVACEAIMARREAEKVGDTDPIFVIKPTYEQFKNWNCAALEDGKLIENWALDGLDELANKISERALAVAEKKGKYSPKD